MSVISAHIGAKQITFLVVGDSGSHDIFSFPFVYNPALQDHFTNRETFYTHVFKHVIGKFGLSAQDSEIFVCNDLEPSEIDLDLKANLPALDVLSEIPDINLMYINATTSVALSRIEKEDVILFLSNLALVPNMIVEKAKYKMYHDFVRFGSISKVYELDPRMPVLFFGDRFSSEYEMESEKYQSLLSHIRTPGIFNVSVDTKGAYLPSMLLKKYRPKLYEAVATDISPTVLGTVVRVEKPTECMFKTDYTESQFFEVPLDSLFFVPLEEGSKAQVIVKSQTIDQYEGEVRGGKLGFVVDTRPIDKDGNGFGLEEENIVSYENISKQIEETLAVI